MNYIVCVIGLGYIGLPTSAVIAMQNIPVHGVDINPKAVEMINQGKIHIIEKDLDQIVHQVVSNGFLKADTKPCEANVYIIAVPTPFKDNHQPDLAYVEAAVTSIIPLIKQGDLIILESTSPVGSTEHIAHMIAEARPELTLPNYKSNNETNDQIYIAYCPERVLPGHILQELVENDRIIGGMDSASTEKAQAFYQRFVKGAVLATDCRTAEMAKLTENAFRDVNIAFANELSMIADKIDIDVWELIRLANRHPRVNILQPGPGVGGHCIAVDPWFIVDKTPEEARLIRTAREVNDSKPHFVLQKIVSACAEKTNPKIACLGLAFKANIDDLRESPAVEIVDHLATLHIGEILVVEPHIEALPKQLARHQDAIKLINLDEALLLADVLVILVDHNDFKSLDKAKLHAHTQVIDTRGIFA